MGDFIAKTNIPVGEALAYTRGQRVLADAVKDNGWEDLVVGDNTKEAREIRADISGRPAEDFGPPATAGRASAATSSEQKG